MNKKKIITILSTGLMVLTLSACGGNNATGKGIEPEQVEDGVLSGISLSGNYQTEFEQDSVFNTDGLIVKGIYTDATMRVVTGYQVSSPDMTTVGNKTVTVTYQESGHTVSKSYTIKIVEKYVPPSPEEIPEDKTVSLNNQTISKEQSVSYTFTSDDKPEYVEFVKARIHVDMNGNDTSHDWWGGYFYLNGAKIEISSSLGVSKEVAGPDSSHNTSADYVFTYEISQNAKLSANNTAEIKISYNADGLTFKAVSLDFNYGAFNPRVSETVQLTDSYVKYEGATLTSTIQTSTLINKGKVKKIILNTSFTNDKTYGSGTFYFTGINVNPLRSNSLQNIGGYIPKKASDEDPAITDIADINCYPVTELDLKAGVDITITTWYSSASTIKINSVTFVTEVENAPSGVTNLEAYGVDQGVALSWTADSSATSYDIYNGDTLIGNTTKNYYSVSGLVNDTTYTFGVVAKNSIGSSTKVTCQGTPVKGSDYDQFIDGINTSLEQTIGAAGLKQMFDAANYDDTESNNYRLKNVISKLEYGINDVNIAYVGGSITVGENATLKDENNHQKGYAYYTFDWLKNTYATDKTKIHFTNASISGTDSTIALTRIQQDVIDKNPDLIFIEFAGNNSNNDVDNCTYESLVKKCVSLPNKPAVVLVFCATSYTGSTEVSMRKIGNHYGLPMVSMHQACLSVMDKSEMTKDKTQSTSNIWKGFINDGTHPTDDGHKLFGKVVASYLRSIDKDTEDTEFVLPSAPSKTNFDKFANIVDVNHTLNNNIVTSLGSFEEADTSTNCTSKQSDTIGFQNGWIKKANSGNSEMVINVTAKNFILTYECGNPNVTADNNPKGDIIVSYQNKNIAADAGSYEWSLTQTLKQSSWSDLTPPTSGSNGWQNPASIIIFDKSTSSDYEIKIKTKNNTDICVIFAVAYTA